MQIKAQSFYTTSLVLIFPFSQSSISEVEFNVEIGTVHNLVVLENLESLISP